MVLINNTEFSLLISQAKKAVNEYKYCWWPGEMVVKGKKFDYVASFFFDIICSILTIDTITKNMRHIT
jgi:hypothetical protein